MTRHAGAGDRTVGVGLLLAVSSSLSRVASRTVLSTSVVFLVGGCLLGWAGAIDVGTGERGAVSMLAEFALFSSLYSDGMRIGLRAVRRGGGLAAGALVIGLPATMLLVAVLASGLLDLPWRMALLLGAVLAPTDPVFASALVERDGVPAQIRRLLNLESGLNDGLSLPVVVLLLGAAAPRPESWSRLTIEAVGGVGIGACAGLGALLLLRQHLLRPPGSSAPTILVGIGVATYGLCATTGANEFLAAFVTGITVRTLRSTEAQAFHEHAKLVVDVVAGNQQSRS